MKALVKHTYTAVLHYVVQLPSQLVCNEKKSIPTSVITAFYYLDYSENNPASIVLYKNSINWRASVLTPVKETGKSVCVCLHVGFVSFA